MGAIVTAVSDIHTGQIDPLKYGNLNLHPDTFKNWTFADLTTDHDKTNNTNMHSALNLLMLSPLAKPDYSILRLLSDVFKNLSFSDMKTVCGFSKNKGGVDDCEQSLLGHAISRKPFINLLADSLDTLTPKELNQPISVLGKGEKSLAELAKEYPYLNELIGDSISYDN